MTGNKRSTPNTSRIGSDLAKVDAHTIAPEEYDEAPELTEDWFAKADLREGGKLVRRGRPKAEAPKQHVSLRLAPDVLEPFKASGQGWQGRIEETLRVALAEGRAAGVTTREAIAKAHTPSRVKSASVPAARKPAARRRVG